MQDEKEKLEIEKIDHLSYAFKNRFHIIYLTIIRLIRKVDINSI